MAVQLKDISKQVIVITGASSGIGLTAARMAARRGAKLVLASRSDAALRALREEIESAGGHAISVVTDVSRQEDVRNLAQTAIEYFGGFDTWVNNAGLAVYGKIRDVPVEDERIVFDVNYWGTVYGSRVAAEHLRKGGGALINVGSVASDRGFPLLASYCASKHAIKSFTDTLRSELKKEGAPVSVTLIKPAAIDTPFFRHAKTYLGAQPTEPPPMYAPDTVAKAILSAAERPVRDVLVGGMAPFQSALGLRAPKLGDLFVNATMFGGQKSQRQPEPGDNQILEQPSGKLHERGGYGTMVIERSTYTEAMTNPAVKRVAAFGAGLAVAGLFLARGRR